MTKQVEFIFDFGSPASYLAWTQLPKIAAAAAAQIVWKPMLLGGVFKATGNASPVTVAAKGKWMMGDLDRCAARYGVPLVMPVNFPVNTLTMMRGAVGVQQRQPADFDRYVKAMFEGMFARGLNMGDPDVLAGVLTAAGFDPATFIALVGDPAIIKGWWPSPKRRSRAARSVHPRCSWAAICISGRTGWTSWPRLWRDNRRPALASGATSHVIDP